MAQRKAVMELNAKDNRKQCYWRRSFGIVCVERVFLSSRMRNRSHELISLALVPRIFSSTMTHFDNFYSSFFIHKPVSSVRNGRTYVWLLAWKAKCSDLVETNHESEYFFLVKTHILFHLIDSGCVYTISVHVNSASTFSILLCSARDVQPFP